MRRHYGQTKAARQAAWLAEFSDALTTLHPRLSGRIEWDAALHYFYSGTTVALTRPIKPMRKPALGRSDKRFYPAYTPGVTSTADYVRGYFALNSKRHKAPAYPDHVDHLALYVPLPDAPAAVYQGLDTVETIE